MDVRILDSGWFKNDRTGTQESVSDRAGYDGSSSVSAFLLPAATLTFSFKADLEATPSPATFSPPDVDLVAVEAPAVDISFSVPKDYAPTGFDVNYFVQLTRLTMTKGLKLLYADGSSTNKKTLLELLGAKNSAGVFQGTGKELASGTNYLVGRVVSVELVDSGKSGRFGFDMKFLIEW